jgi:DNA-binding NarL/FixJ family response regulator
VRLTDDQDLVLRWVADEDVPALHARLDAAGLSADGAHRVLDPTSCPGAETCRLAVTESRRLGADLAAHLRATRPALKVLFTSGYSYEGIGHQGELTPDTAFLQKPFTPAALARAVRQVLDAPSTGLSGAGVAWT